MRQGRLLPARYSQRPAGKGNVQTGSELNICQVFATHRFNLGRKQPTGQHQVARQTRLPPVCCVAKVLQISECKAILFSATSAVTHVPSGGPSFFE